ncbi:MAG: histidine kinase [Acidobacteriota bacterium]
MVQHLSAKLITAQEEERRSIARELHDEVGQVLTAIKVELAVAQRTMQAGGSSSQLLEDARSITEGAITTVPDLSHLLHRRARPAGAGRDVTESLMSPFEPPRRVAVDG